MVLFCGHSICKSCIDKLRVGPHVSCPLDKKKSTYSDISVNFALQAVLESSSQGPKCQHHPFEVTHFFCTKDRTLICQRCLLTEHRGHPFEDGAHAKKEAQKIQDNKRLALDSLQEVASQFEKDKFKLARKIEERNKDLAAAAEKLVRDVMALKARLQD